MDRTTDGSGYVSEMTLEDLKALDAGYYFKDDQGNFPFRGQGIKLLTIEELFEAFPNERFVIEIKDTNPKEYIEDLSLRLNSLIEKYDMTDQVFIASFDQDIIETFQSISNGQVAVSGGRKEVTKFVVFNKFFLKNLYFPKVDAIQIPTSDSGFDLTTNDIIKGANRINLQVVYWTINDKETMRALINKGADGIITDRPDLLIEVLNEMGY
ncbi:glycerophosphodiester phosphodiesterase [Bacillaceae bacterium W0354]